MISIIYRYTFNMAYDTMKWNDIKHSSIESRGKKLKNVNRLRILALFFSILIFILPGYVHAVDLVKTNIATFSIKSADNIIASSFVVGKTYTVAASATSINKPMYRFWLGDLTTGKWIMLQDYSLNSTIKWTPAYAGDFEVSTHVRDSNSNLAFEAVKFSDIKVSNPILGKAGVPTFSIIPSETYVNDPNGYYIGRHYQLTSIATSTNKTLYRFWWGDLTTGKWVMLQNYSTNSSINWKAPYAGKFELSVHVKDSLSRNEYDSVKFSDFTVNNTSSSISDFKVLPLGAYSTDPTGYYTGRTYSMTAAATSTTKALYRFFVGDLSTGKWTMLQDYGMNNSIKWTAPYPGKFELSTHVKDINSPLQYEAVKFNDIVVLNPTAQVNDFTIIPNGTFTIDAPGFYVGKSFKLTASASSTNKALYRFWMGDLTTGKWTMLQNYSTNNSINWAAPYAGKFEVSVHIKDVNSSKEFDSVKFSDIVVKNPISVANNFVVTPLVVYNIDPTGFYKNRSYKISASATATTKALYRFWMGDLTTGKWTMLQDYSLNSAINWTAPYAGKFELSVHIRDMYSTKPYDSVKLKDFTVKNWTSNIEKYAYSMTNYNYTLPSMVTYQNSFGSSVYEDANFAWAPASTSLIGYYANPMNLVNDNYQQYEFLTLNYIDGISVNDINNLLLGKGVLQGKGAEFLSASKISNVNVIYLVAHALLETGNGTSNLARGIVVNGKVVYNMFGVAAYDSNPDGYGSQYAYSQGWFTIDQAILGGSNFIGTGYINNSNRKQNTLYKMRWDPGNYGSASPHQYATDVRWAYNQVYNIKRLLDLCPNAKLVFDVPVFSN